MARLRRVLGNSAATCAMSRDPLRLGSVLRAAGIPFPPGRMDGAAPAAGRWLQKSLHSGGGLGITRATARAHLAPGHYWQQHVAGEAQSAVYVADAGHATLLGVTRQLVGWPEFHAPEFSYCGSLGPLAPAPELLDQWRTLGNVLARELDLRGLFGVDAVVADGRVTVIEVNPRYTASVEVLEAALGIAAVKLHLAAWGLAGGGPTTSTDAGGTGNTFAGKAILFAPRDLEFKSAAAVAGAGAAVFADIPAPGTPVAAGAPILSVLCRADGAAECESLLRRAAADVYRVLL
jgi:predicted ATP-grasp superfamily ATP-dependent carboligase